MRTKSILALLTALTVLPLAASGQAGAAFSPILPTNDQITVSSSPADEAGVAEIGADCETTGGTLYIDRSFAGTVPYSGRLAPGSHYFELQMSGFDTLGIWLTLQEKTKYKLVFNPNQTIPLFASDKRVGVSSEPTLTANLATYDIFCNIGGGELYVDKIDLGIVPTANIPFESTTTPGSHYFEFDLPGYHPLTFWLLLNQMTKYTITLTPERIMGFISIKVEPADAAVTIDGTSVDWSKSGGGSLQVPAGSHKLLIQRFGYVEQRLDVDVTEKATYFVRLSLVQAPFSIAGLGFDRPVFNPRNAGLQGRTNLVFNSSNYGSAQAEIRGPDGEVVATLQFPNIQSWAQSGTWNGLGPDGTPLPDGTYSVLLTAKPAPGAPAQPEGKKEDGEEVGPDGSVTLSTEARIDSSLVIRSIGTASALPGLLYMPDPMIQPAGTLTTEASWFAPWGAPQNSAFGLSAALSVAGVATVAAYAAVETGSTAQSDLALSTLFSLFGDRTSLLGGGVFVRGSYSSSPAPSMPGAGSGVEASLPLSLRLGDFSLAISPGTLLDLSAGSPTLLGLARAGIWLEGRSFRVGASGELPIAFTSAGPAPEWPAEAALEGRVMLGSTPFVASCYLEAALEPGAAPSLGIGLGLGLLY